MKEITFIFTFALFFSSPFTSEDIFRRVRSVQIIPSPPNVKGEVLLKNLYVLINCHPALLFELKNIYPTLSQISGTKIANTKLSEDELNNLLEEISKITKKAFSLKYSSYESTYEKPSWDFENFLDLFVQEFLHTLNTSSSMEPVLKLVQGLVAAEYIAGESKHRLGSQGWRESLIKWHKWILTGGEEDKTIPQVQLRKYYDWDKLALEDKKFIMACVYIILVNKGRDISLILSRLAEDSSTKESIKNIRNIIEKMFLDEALKNKVLSFFPK